MQIKSLHRNIYKLYRYRKILSDLEHGIMPPSKKPKKLNKTALVRSTKAVSPQLRQRWENPTWGKQKITVILHRDHGQTLSKSTVGRILKTLDARNSSMLKYTQMPKPPLPSDF